MEKDYILNEVGNKDKIIICFPSLGGTHRYYKLSEYTGINTLLLSCEENSWGFKGFYGLGNDIESNSKALKELTKEYKQVFTFGSSAGGYCALLYGLKINADKIFNFDGQSQPFRHIPKELRITITKAVKQNKNFKGTINNFYSDSPNDRKSLETITKAFDKYNIKHKEISKFNPIDETHGSVMPRIYEERPFLKTLF